jgi:hypothetical protein
MAVNHLIVKQNVAAQRLHASNGVALVAKANHFAPYPSQADSQDSDKDNQRSEAEAKPAEWY